MAASSATPAGIKFAQQQILVGLQAAKTQMANQGEQGKAALAGLGMYDALVAALDKEISHSAVGLRMADDGAIHVVSRTLRKSPPMKINELFAILLPAASLAFTCVETPPATAQSGPVTAQSRAHQVEGCGKRWTLNFHVLGMWHASQNKDIIGAATGWEMPDLYTSTNGVWRVGDERYPSFVSFHKEPLVRVKLSGDGKTLLVVACNPHNKGVEQVRVRRPGGSEEYRFQLVGDFPIIQRFPVVGVRCTCPRTTPWFCRLSLRERTFFRGAKDDVVHGQVLVG